MKPSDDIHWTENPELIERFVLNQLNPDERNELEDHLRICEVCKRTLRMEQILLAGIRRSGREQFRVELQKKLSSAKTSSIPWPHILSAAAVIVLLTGIGIYNRWFQAVQPVDVQAPSVVPSEPMQAEHTEGPGIRTDSQPVETLTQSGEVEVPSRRADPPPSQSKQALREKVNDLSTASSVDEPKEEKAVAPKVLANPASGAASRVGADASGQALNPEDAFPPKTFWVVGHISRPEVAPSTLQSAESEKPHTTMRKRADTPAGSATQEKHRVEYRSLSSLPSAQQNLVEADKPLAEVRKEQDIFIITLYRERPLAPDASVTRQEDTLIVQTGDMTYSFPIPPPLLQRNQAEPAR